MRGLLPRRCAMPRELVLRWSPQMVETPARRCYSAMAMSIRTEQRQIDPAKLIVNKTKTPKAVKKPEDLVFGSTFTDHMLTVEWDEASGWHAPKIVPYANLPMDPASCVFHYAFCAFEGMKAYKSSDGKIRLFRPDKNMERLNKSVSRIALPTVDGAAVTKLIGELAKLDQRFVPTKDGYALYLRPTMIGTQKTLGVSPPKSAMLFVIASPVGPYYPSGFKAVTLEATDYAVRAWPGGVGDKKLGANYAPCILPQREAMSRGYSQNLWLFGEEAYITEAGTMNLFMAIKDKETGQKELVTPPLDGTILEGVTRNSLLSLAREKLIPEGWKVSERSMTMKELSDASDEGRTLEVFGAGTAVVIAPVRSIGWQGKTVSCGLKDDEEGGEFAIRMKKWMEARQFGHEEHEWSHVC